MIEIESSRSIPVSGSVVYDVPGDISAAYFLLAAAILSKTAIRLQDVLLNPTRTRALELLRTAFTIEVTDVREIWNESRGDITLLPSEVTPWSLEIAKDDVPLVIDELPILAVLGACSNGLIIVRDAGELRYKESDRIQLVVANLRKCGVDAQEFQDGFIVRGGSLQTVEVKVDHSGDHRIAMAFAVMAACGSRVTIPNHSVVNVSFPGYFHELEKIIGRGKLQCS
jgi:3-phosphoshikimate 1-carboxyvinyltransferase